jgi:hypothetical protein
MFTGSKTPLAEGLSADQYISSHEAADRYHQHPLHETSPRHLSDTSFVCFSTSEQVRFQRSLYLCSSHEKSSCSGRLG